MGDLTGHLELSAPASVESIDLTHTLLEHLWQQNPQVDPACRLRVETAAIEVMANIVEHAFKHDGSLAETRGSRRLTTTLGVHADGVVVGFCDDGRPAEIDLSTVTMPDETAESGRGLAMALAAVDELVYDRRDGRNYWSLLCAI
ncbi:ATP-binding protein [Nocardioides sp.]|uniref:ATP-binding protein n=1 Tax=Nocardioides sp. TaxID=35761 RepID=UPI00286C4F16|nr:ATP-binding protein [Nocardioides sp.]